MELGLEGKVALVTGGGRGIGAAVCLALARSGCDLAIVECGPIDGAQALAETILGMGRRSQVFQADVADFALAERVVAEITDAFGRLDIVVCSAGIAEDSVIWKMSEAQWDRVLDVNLKGTMNYNRAAAPVLRKLGGGKIVNISSINGLRGKFGQSNYAASKGGIIALSKTLAKELGKFNINVNVVAPGMVRTEMTERLPAEARDQALQETVLGRLAEPQDVADLVVFLCSDSARQITGEVIKIDGGQYI